MQMVAKVVTEFFMMVMCVVVAPSDQQEFHIDVISENGYMDTLIVKREAAGFAVYDEAGEEQVKIGTITSMEGENSVFVFTQKNDERQIIDLKKGIPEFDSKKMKNEEHLNLKTADGDRIKVDRSGKVVYVSLGRTPETFVVH